MKTLVLLFLFCAFAFAQYESVIDSLMDDAIKNQAFPGATIIVGDRFGQLFYKNYGKFTYDANATPISDETVYDLASVTKVLSTTTAVAMFYQRGELSMNTRITEFFPDFANKGKSEITIEHLLLHNSGFPPDPNPNYWQRGVGCPETFKYHPEQVFTCQEIIFNNLMNQTLSAPIGEKYVYSDLSMITLMYVIGHLAKKHKYVKDSDVKYGCPIGGKGDEQCYYEAYVRLHIFEKLRMKSACFRPEDASKIPPAWNDTYYHHELIQGYVSDENAYAMGGIAGHAGMFSTALDVELLLRSLMFREGEHLVNQTTMDFFSFVRNTNQSSRALGWDTMMTAELPGLCGTLSRETIMHTGYSGTEVCLDPIRKVYTIFFTNRVYPSKENVQISKYRRQVNSKIQEIYDVMSNKSKVIEYIVIAIVGVALMTMIVSAATLGIVIYLRRRQKYQPIIESQE